MSTDERSFAESADGVPAPSKPGAGIRVCVVEDDEDLREELVAGLGDFGFEVRGFHDSLGLYRGLLAEPCELVVLDVGLPHEDGFAVAASLREFANVGIIFFTGRGATEDRVRGLMEGGDAYLVKPVDLRELVATLVSVRRRMMGTCEVLPPDAPAAASGGNWALTPDGWSLLAPTRVVVALTSMERSLMQYLFEHAGEVASRASLVQALGHRLDYYDNHRLDVLVSRLRRKVKSEAGCVLPLRAVRGHGFILSL